MSLASETHIFGLPFPSPGDLPDPGIKPRPTVLQADSLPTDERSLTQEIIYISSGVYFLL